MWEVLQDYDKDPAAVARRLGEDYDAGRRRSRYLHNCVAVNDERIFLIQRHGTLEEIGVWAREAGARDAVILDNGGSVFAWAWWPPRMMPEGKQDWGGYINSASDFRPPTSSAISFVLHGPVAYQEPPGAVSFHQA